MPPSRPLGYRVIRITWRRLHTDEARLASSSAALGPSVTFASTVDANVTLGDAPRPQRVIVRAITSRWISFVPS